VSQRSDGPSLRDFSRPCATPCWPPFLRAGYSWRWLNQRWPSAFSPMRWLGGRAACCAACRARAALHPPPPSGCSQQCIWPQRTKRARKPFTEPLRESKGHMGRVIMVLAHRVAGELCSALPPAGSCYDVCVCVWERASVRERESVCVHT